MTGIWRQKTVLLSLPSTVALLLACGSDDPREVPMESTAQAAHGPIAGVLARIVEAHPGGPYAVCRGNAQGLSLAPGGYSVAMRLVLTDAASPGGVNNQLLLGSVSAAAPIFTSSNFGAFSIELAESPPASGEYGVQVLFESPQPFLFSPTDETFHCSVSICEGAICGPSAVPIVRATAQTSLAPPRLAVDEANAARLAGQHLRCKWRLHIGGRGDLVGPFEVVASTVTDVGADSSFFTIAAGDPTVGPLSTSNGGTLLGEWVPAPASLQSPSLEVRFDRFPLPASRSGRCNFSVEDLGTGTVLGTSTATAYSGFPPCIDGVDNDGDGRSDYPNDPGCADPNDNDETDDCPNGSNCPECSNEIDDDNFGDIDFPADPECDWAADDDEGPRTACSNGIDDDGDAKTDWPSDPGCNSPADNDEGDG